MYPGPPTATARSPRADAVRNHARVLEAGAEAFAEHGAEVQMDDVAARAGVGVGTVYRHFATKQDLLDALLLERIGEALEAARDARGAHDPWDGFASVMRRAAEMQAADRGFADLLAAGAGQTEAVQRAKAELHEAIATVMARAQDAGELRPDVSIADVPGLMCSLAGVVSMADRAGWERYLAILLDGLRASGTSAAPLPR